MKFGKNLRQQQNLPWNLKWADSYVDYKLLKQLIKALSSVEDNSRLSVEEILDRAKEVLGEDFALVSSKSPEGNSLLLSPLQDQGDIALSLPSEEELKQGENSFDSESTSPETESNLGIKHIRRSSFSSVVKDIRQKSFMEVLRREFTRVDNLCRNELNSISKRIQSVTEKYVSETAQKDEPILSKAEISEKQLQVRKSYLALIRALERVEAFLEINSTAMEKIVKKFDKRIRAVDADYPTLASQVEPFLNKMIHRYDDLMSKMKKKLEGLLQKYGKPMEMEKIEIQNSELDELIVEDEVPTLTELRLSSFPPESINRFRLVLAYDGLGEPVACPVIVVKGKYQGPVLGITAALHGNELNGIPLIHKLIREIEVDSLSGTLVAIPVLNAPGFLRHQRGFLDGQDLNRLFPGKPSGNSGQVYCYQVMQKIMKHLNYHIDMHTASFGRVNSLYVRADMNNRTTHQMARLQEPQIIVHNTAPDGSLRSAAMKIGIPSITVEIGDPSRIHRVIPFPSFLRALISDLLVP